MYQYRVSGQLEYLLRCPQAPDIAALCDPPTSCNGHPFRVDVTLYVVAPDPARAHIIALGKLKSAYPLPLFAHEPEITPILRPAAHAAPASDPLPGFSAFLHRPGAEPR